MNGADCGSDLFRRRGFRLAVAVALLLGTAGTMWQFADHVRQNRQERAGRVAALPQMLASIRSAHRETLEEEGKRLLEGPLHESDATICTMAAAGSTPFAVVTGRVEQDGISVVIADCHPCHEPSDQCDHTSAVRMQVSSLEGDFADVGFQCTLLNDSGGRFSVEMPCGQYEAIATALHTMGLNADTATRSDFQHCLDRIYLPCSDADRQVAIQQLVYLLCHALSERVPAAWQNGAASPS